VKTAATSVDLAQLVEHYDIALNWVQRYEQLSKDLRIPRISISVIMKIVIRIEDVALVEYDIFFLKSLLQMFSNSTGLRVNYSKSMMVLINISDANVSVLAQTFGCSIGSFPFTYLGLPLGLTKPKVEDFLPLVTRCERRLISTSIYLSQAGKLQMTNTIFSALPTFYLCTVNVHQTVIDQIVKYRKHCLRRGADPNAKSPSKPAWEMVCLPKTEGGFGILQLHTQ
jgi:hypothetical protein